MAERASPPTPGDLRRLLRASTLLDPPVRRQWLKVVDHLDAVDRSRLAEILREAGSAGPEQSRASQ
jgi:uncharacterized membrane-anchored protein